jgi:hypothetical protein
VSERIVNVSELEFHRRASRSTRTQTLRDLAVNDALLIECAPGETHKVRNSIGNSLWHLRTQGYDLQTRAVKGGLAIIKIANPVDKAAGEP